MTGTLIAEVADLKQNGELIQTNNGVSSSPLSGTVQGVVLYNEGFLLLTGAAPIMTLIGPDGTSGLNLRAGSGRFNPSWLYWGAGARDGGDGVAVREDVPEDLHRDVHDITGSGVVEVAPQ